MDDLVQNDTTNIEGLDDISELIDKPPIFPAEIEGSNRSIMKRKRTTYAFMYYIGLTQMVGAMTKTAEAMDKSLFMLKTRTNLSSSDWKTPG